VVFIWANILNEVCLRVMLYVSRQQNIITLEKIKEERLKLGTSKKICIVKVMEFTIKGYYRC
jgi:hypothetical protein